MNIGERIKQRRKELHMSAETLAERIGKSPATIYRYERGDIDKVDSRVIPLIADVLSVEPGYLMGWEDTLDSDDAAEILPSVDPSEVELLNIYRGLNDAGKNTLMNMARSLNTNPDMKKECKIERRNGMICLIK